MSTAAVEPARRRWHQTEPAPHFTRTEYVRRSPDGRRWPEVQLHTATYDAGDGRGVLTHATDRGRRFDTMCGRSFWNACSGTEFHRIAAVDCADCRRKLDPR